MTFRHTRVRKFVIVVPLHSRLQGPTLRPPSGIAAWPTVLFRLGMLPSTFPRILIFSRLTLRGGFSLASLGKRSHRASALSFFSSRWVFLAPVSCCHFARLCHPLTFHTLCIGTTVSSNDVSPYAGP